MRGALLLWVVTVGSMAVACAGPAMLAFLIPGIPAGYQVAAWVASYAGINAYLIASVIGHAARA